MWTWQGGEGSRVNLEIGIYIYTYIHIHAIICKIDREWEHAIKPRKLRWMLCDDLEEWEGGPRGKGYMYIYS